MGYSIELNIDRLILEGFSIFDRNIIRNSVQNELIRLFNENGIPASVKENRDISKINLGDIKTQTNSNAGLIGNQVAQNIYSAISNDRL